MIAAIVISGTTTSQVVLWERVSPIVPPPPAVDNIWGNDIHVLTDVNADGADDVIVSSEFSNNGPLTQAGHVCILSGVDGSTIHEWHGPGFQDMIRALGTTGDLDGDGAGDFAMVNYSGGVGYVTLVSGATGADLPTSANVVFGRIRPVGDLNLDGTADFASTVTGGFTVYAGPDGGVTLWSVFPSPWQALLGYPALPMPDLNNDGVPEVLAGAGGLNCYLYQSSPFYIPLTGHARVLSGATGAQLQQFTGSGTCDQFGWAMAAPGDFDGDGQVDFVIADFALQLMKAVSSANGGTLATIPIQQGGLNVMPVVALGDIDADGYGDYAFRFITTATNGIRVIGGASHNVMYSLEVVTPYGGELGHSLASAGDVNGDGVPDLAVGFPHYFFGGIPGRVRMYSLLPPGVTPFGQGCALTSGEVPQIGVSGPAIPGGTVRVNLSKVPPGRGAALVVGASNTTFGTTALPWSLAGLGLPGCELLISLDEFVPAMTAPIGSGKGAVSLVLDVPNIAALSGVTFYGQWAVDNAPGAGPIIAMSRGMSVTIQ